MASDPYNRADNGYVNDQSTPASHSGDNIADLQIPPAGIEDVDRAVYDLFNEVIPFQVEQRGKQGNLTQPARGATSAVVKVPVIFATGERFAHVKKLLPFRDSNNTIILPLISVGRKGLEIGTPRLMPSISHRATSDFVISRRLAPEDRNYQRLINKQHVRNSPDIAARSNFQLQDVSPGSQSVPGTIASRRNEGNLSFLDPDPNLPLLSRHGDNIFEIITMPYPVFFSASYEVTFWTQYTQHMNAMLETLASARKGPGFEYKVKSRKGYFYIIELEPSINSSSNTDEFSDTERIIKNTLTCNVMGYIMATAHPGQEQPIKRYLSAPTVDFIIRQTSGEVELPLDNSVPSGDESKFALTDIKEIDPRGRDTLQRGQEDGTVPDTIEDPFTGSRVRVLTRNPRKGETVASSRLVVDLERTRR